MKTTNKWIGITAVLIVVMFLGTSIHLIQLQSPGMREATLAQPAGEHSKTFEKFNENGITFIHSTAKLLKSGNERMLHLELVYTYSSAISNSQTGGNKSLSYQGTEIRVNFRHHKMYITINVYIPGKMRQKEMNTYGSPRRFGVRTEGQPGTFYAHLYTKSLSGYNAGLFLERIPIYSLTVYSVGTVGLMLGAAVGYGEGIIISFNPEAVGAVAYIAGLLIADLGALYAYATLKHVATIYFEEGFSYGTQWYNFYNIGAYGEEGTYNAYYESSNGIYTPLITSFGLYTTAMIPHTGAWNPNAQPPW